MNLKTAFLLLFILNLASVAPAQNDTIEKTFFYEDGSLSSKGKMYQELPVGYWKTYYPSGLLKSEGNRSGVDLDGVWKFYGPTGDLEKEITFLIGKRQGLTNYYNDSCELIKIEPYVNDKLEGDVLEYYEKGRILKNLTPYVAGIKDGIAYEYGKDGRIITITTYNHGFIKKKEEINRRNELGKQGTWKEFFIDGSLHIESRYKNDLLHGYYKEYDREGILQVALLYLNGILQENPEELTSLDLKRKYYDNGAVEWEGTYNYQGQEEGTFKYFSPKGEIKEAKIYSKGILLAQGKLNKEGERIEEWEFFYPDSSLRAKGDYEDGLRVGNWVFYHPNGKLEQKGKFGKEEKPQGEWVWYYNNGQVWREENFWKGREDGKVVEYSDSGTVITTGEYIDGKKEGPWRYVMGDHTEEGSYLEGRKNGEWIHTYSNDKTSFKGSYINGDPHGRHIYYYPNGRIKREEYFELGFEEGTWRSYDELGNLVLSSEWDGGREVRIEKKKVK